MKRFIFSLFLMLFILCGANATTFYIADNGSDSNAGTKVAPWLHAPGMAGATGNPAAYSCNNNGDSFVLRGGDSWHNTGVPSGLSWYFGCNGSSGHPISFGGLDQTWSNGSCTNGGIVDTFGTLVVINYYGESTIGTSTTPFVMGSSWVGGAITINGVSYTIASVINNRMLTLSTSAGNQSGKTYSNSLWCRPILNADGVSIPINGAGSSNVMFQGNFGGAYRTVDNIEFRGLAATVAGGVVGYGIIMASDQTTGPNYDQVLHCYFHGWSHDPWSGTFEDPETIVVWINLGSATAAVGQEIGWNDVDGSDSLDSVYWNGTANVSCSGLPSIFLDGKCATGTGVNFEGYNIHDNLFKYNTNAVVTNNTHILANNDFSRIYGAFDVDGIAQHTNGWEFNGEFPDNNFVYNNMTRYVTAGETSQVSAVMTTWVFNNVWYQCLQQLLDVLEQPNSKIEYFNNTMVDGGGSLQNNGYPLSSYAASAGTGQATISGSGTFATSTPVAIVGSTNGSFNQSTSGAPQFNITSVVTTSALTHVANQYVASQSASNCTIDGMNIVSTATSDGNGFGTFNFSPSLAGTSGGHSITNCGIFNGTATFTTLIGSVVNFTTGLTGTGTGGRFINGLLDEGNNIFINTLSPTGTWAGSSANDTNWTTGQGTSAGFTLSGLYLPTSANCNTTSPCNIGAALNLTSDCSGSLVPLCSDSSRGDTVISVTRPASAAWDGGADQFATSPLPSPPTSVSNTNGGSSGAHTVVITWNASVTSGVSYFIFRGSTSGGESNTPLNMGGVGTNCTGPMGGCTYTDSAVLAGQTWFYTVEANDGMSYSAPSNEIMTSIPVTAPTGLVITGVN
jgi:hypothetical protein